MTTHRNPEKKDRIIRSQLSSGVKDDEAKIDYSLINDDAEAEFAAVLTYGAEKYDRDNYLLVENLKERYYASTRRHLRAARSGEVLDPENRLMHLAEAACGIHFLLAHELKQDPNLVLSLSSRLQYALAEARKIRLRRG